MVETDIIMASTELITRVKIGVMMLVKTRTTMTSIRIGGIGEIEIGGIDGIEIGEIGAMEIGIDGIGAMEIGIDGTGGIEIDEIGAIEIKRQNAREAKVEIEIEIEIEELREIVVSH